MFSWKKSWFKTFEITRELHCNLKNLKSWFSHENINKSNFFLENIPPKCCYSASFGILWTHIDIFTYRKFWHISRRFWVFEFLRFWLLFSFFQKKSGFWVFLVHPETTLPDGLETSGRRAYCLFWHISRRFWVLAFWKIFSVFQKNRVFGYSWSTLLWYRCYYPHRSRDALSPVCGIFKASALWASRWIRDLWSKGVSLILAYF